MKDLFAPTKEIVKIVEAYGEDSLAYLTLEKGKKYFISEKIKGLIAYVVVKKIALCLGNPICQREDITGLLNEFEQYCEKNKWKICYCSVSESIIEYLKKTGYRCAKYGEEAILDLTTYTIAGGSRLKLRQKIKRAAKLGIRTIEYYPQQKRDYELEKRVLQVSEQWCSKKNGKLTFTLGDINFEAPLSRRYFIALGPQEEVEAILVFCPYNHGRGYFLDVMRRKQDSAISGVMERAIIDVATKMKEEGINFLSLGIAPLAGIKELNKRNSLEKCMSFTYEHLNYSYGFQSLYDYKRKFAPSMWVSRYVVYDRHLSSLNVGFAMIRAKKTDHFWSEVGRDFLKAGQYTLKNATAKLMFKYRKKFLFRKGDSKESRTKI